MIGKVQASLALDAVSPASILFATVEVLRMNCRKWLRGALAGLAALLAILSISGAQIDTAVPWAKPQANKDTIDFGPVVVGRSGTATYVFKVLETSERSATVAITRPHAPFDLQGVPTAPFTLAPGQSITFTVIFLPADQGSYASDFTITSEGGYPPQRTTTIVTLSGRGVVSGETPPSEATSPAGPAPPATEMTTPFGLPLSATETAAGAVPGTTDGSGRFTVTLSLTTTVTGSLSVCEEGQPLANQPFGLTKASDGYAITATGFAPVTVQEASALTVFGLTSVDLGDVCLTPAPPVVEEPLTERTCEIKYEWLKKTPIEVIEPLDYVPKQASMPLGGIIAFHIRATDQDVLKQTCYGCVEGESVKRIGPVADVVSNHWELNCTPISAPCPGGKLLGWSEGNYGDVLYQLPEELAEGESLLDNLSCRIDDLEGPLAKANDDPVYASALITITGQRGNTCRVTVKLFNPVAAPSDDDATPQAAEDCTPGKEAWEEGRQLILSPYVSECMCAGQLYLLHVHPDDIDIDALTLKCDAATCEGSSATLRVSDPTAPTWSDNGAGGSFPFGNRGFGVTYQAPATGKDVKITCTIDDSGTAYDDKQLQKERKCTAVKILRVLPGDPTTHEIPSVLPAANLPRQHFVTVRQTASGQDKMKLEAQIQPNTDAARRCIIWVGAQADAANPLVGLVPRTAALKQPVRIQVGERTCKHLMVWVIWCDLSGSAKGVTADYLKNGPLDYLYVIEGPIVWTAIINPKAIITDTDRPDLEGAPNPAHLPLGTNSSGDLLAGGVDAKWDMSRQIRKRLFAGPPLQAVANPPPFENVPSYPTTAAAWIDVTGNDDAGTGDESNNPYAAFADPNPDAGLFPTSPRLSLSHAVGEITSLDRPTRSLRVDPVLGNKGEQRRWRLNFREFARVQLDGHWYRCSDWGVSGPWRFHIAAVNSPIGPFVLWIEEVPPGHILDLTNKDW